MYCRNCGKEVHPQAVACPGCGVFPLLEKKYCPGCGTATQPNQAMCTKCGVALSAKSAQSGSKSKLAAGLLGILLGGLGIHKFYLGYTAAGVIMLVVSVLVSVLTCGMGYVVMYVIGLIEGILYLTKSDEEFERMYVQGRKPWF